MFGWFLSGRPELIVCDRQYFLNGSPVDAAKGTSEKRWITKFRKR